MIQRTWQSPSFASYAVTFETWPPECQWSTATSPAHRSRLHKWWQTTRLVLAWRQRYIEWVCGVIVKQTQTSPEAHLFQGEGDFSMISVYFGLIPETLALFNVLVENLQDCDVRVYQKLGQNLLKVINCLWPIVVLYCCLNKDKETNVSSLTGVHPHWLLL